MEFTTNLATESPASRKPRPLSVSDESLTGLIILRQKPSELLHPDYLRIDEAVRAGAGEEEKLDVGHLKFFSHSFANIPCLQVIF